MTFGYIIALVTGILAAVFRANRAAVVIVTVLFLLIVTVPAVASPVIVRPPLPSPMPTVRWEPCPDQEVTNDGCYYPPDENQYPHTVFIGKHDAITYWHEVGHAYDATMLDDGERNKFMRLVGRFGPWRWRVPASSFNVSPIEGFAEAYAACALRRRPEGGTWAFTDPYPETDREHAAICRFITRAAA